MTRRSVRRNKVSGVVPAETERNERKTGELMASLETLVAEKDEPTGWLFGDKPTALDAHLVAFIARMVDVGRSNLIPEKLQQYAQWAMQGPEWIKMRDGRSSTMIPT
jgi:glutathione S-transferase